MEASHRQTPYVSPEILQQAVADLQETRPGRGILQVVLRATGQALWVALALGAWLRHEYLLFAALSVGAAFWFASFLSLTHDASHHTLTGIRLLDDVIARAVSWPMTWPIATYTQAHLLHHKMNGADPEDPERIQPLARQYERGNRLTRWLLHHQLGFSMFVAGATGLVISLLTRSMFRFRTSRAMRQALIQDAIGISLTTAAIYSAAYAFGGWYLVGGVALHWIIYERCVGVVHQFRVHAEHYGMWDPQANYFDTQYTNATPTRATSTPTASFVSSTISSTAIPFTTCSRAFPSTTWRRPTGG